LALAQARHLVLDPGQIVFGHGLAGAEKDQGGSARQADPQSSRGRHQFPPRLYVMNDKPVFGYTFFDIADVTIPGDAELPEGKVTLKSEFTPDGSKEGGGDLKLFVDDKLAGEGKLARSAFCHGLEPFELGRDSITAIDPAYRDQGQFPFTGTIEAVKFDLTQR
jgi:hypothetical protein